MQFTYLATAIDKTRATEALEYIKALKSHIRDFYLSWDAKLQPDVYLFILDNLGAILKHNNRRFSAPSDLVLLIATQLTECITPENVFSKPVIGLQGKLGKDKLISLPFIGNVVPASNVSFSQPYYVSVTKAGHFGTINISCFAKDTVDQQISPTLKACITAGLEKYLEGTR